MFSIRPCGGVVKAVRPRTRRAACADAEYNRPGLGGVLEQLDFIGIDAYYPLSMERDPTLAQLVAGWHDAVNPYDTRPDPMHQDNFAEIDKLHKRTGKPIVFTEIGYPADDFAAKNPAADDGPGHNEALQNRAAEALYQVGSDVPWWQGAALVAIRPGLQLAQPPGPPHPRHLAPGLVGSRRNRQPRRHGGSP